MKKHIKGFALAAAAVFGLAACGGSSSTETTEAAVGEYDNLKVAVVYIGVPGDAGRGARILQPGSAPAGAADHDERPDD